MRRNRPVLMIHYRRSEIGRRRSLAGSVALVVLMLIVSGCSGLFGGSGDNAGVFTVRGRVLHDGNAVAGAHVQLGDKNQVTEEDGSYEFIEVPVSGPKMELIVSADGYRTQTRTVISEAGRSFIINVSLEPVTSDPGDGDTDPGEEPGDGDDDDDTPPPVYDGNVAVSIQLVNATGTVAASEHVMRTPGPDLVRSVAAVRQTSLDSYVPGEWIVELDGDYPVQAISTSWADAGVRIERRLSDNFYLVTADAVDVEARLASMPNVVSVGRNRLVHAIATGPVFPNDEFFARQWSLPLISAPYAWSLTTGSKNTVVAVLDSGLRADHPDIDRSALVAGRNFVSDQTATNYTDNTNNFSHGTFVAGIIGARTDNRTGVAGLNWDVTLMPVRVLSSSGRGSIAGVGDGIKWAVDNGANIINMSLAWDSNPNDSGERYVRQQIERAVDHGVVLVAGAGNDDGRITMPAAHPDVIAVGAVDKNKRRAWYSNYGSQLDIVAPGGDQNAASSNGVASTDIVNGRLYYSYSQGTSFSSPHVAGVVALMYSRGITDPHEIREILIDTAEDLGSPGFDVYYGHGLVNAYAAVAGIRRDDAQVGVVGASDYGIEPVQPHTQGDDSIALVEGVAPGRQTAFAWIDVNGDGLLDEGDFAALGTVNVPEKGTATVALKLAVVDTLAATDRQRLQEIVNN